MHTPNTDMDTLPGELVLGGHGTGLCQTEREMRFSLKMQHLLVDRGPKIAGDVGHCYEPCRHYLCLSGKESTCNAGDVGLIPGSGRSPGEGNSNPFQNFCLENPMDRGAWPGTVHGVARVGHDLVTKPP